MTKLYLLKIAGDFWVHFERFFFNFFLFFYGALKNQSVEATLERKQNLQTKWDRFVRRKLKHQTVPFNESSNIDKNDTRLVCQKE